MDIYTFLSLSKEEQELAVTPDSYLCEREEKPYTIKLHAIDDFYVEVFYTSLGETIKFKAFKSRRLLIPYLDNFKIEEVTDW